MIVASSDGCTALRELVTTLVNRFRGCHELAGADAKAEGQNDGDGKEDGEDKSDGLRVSLGVFTVLGSHIMYVVVVDLVRDSIVANLVQCFLTRCCGVISHLVSASLIKVVYGSVLLLKFNVLIVVLLRKGKYALDDLEVDACGARWRRE